MDVLYCLPIIQTARFSAIHALRNSDSQSSTVVGIAVALVWSAVEAAFVWPDFPLYVLILNVFTRSVVLTVLNRVLLKLWREREYAHKDALTGLATRLDFYERLDVEQGRSERSGSPYSLLYIDIDKFKELNDNYGHHVGDEALKVLADILRKSSRKIDVAARFGGDEFVLLLPDADKQSCNILIERIAVEKVGGPTKTSNLMGVANGTVHAWIKAGRVANIDRARELAKLANMRVEDVRPA